MTSHINIGTCVPVSIHTIEARPSKVVKTPYVCDITVDDTLCQAILPHWVVMVWLTKGHLSSQSNEKVQKESVVDAGHRFFVEPG